MTWGKGYSFIGLMILTGVLVQCGKPHPGLHPGAPVILISVDTLRADHLPAYGYTHIKTPAIDGLVNDSVLFQQAFAQAPLTLPSHASLMTGLLPPHHGVRENVGFRLGEDQTTLAEVLRENGYQTGAFLSSMVLRKATGMGQGFDIYDDSFGLGLKAQARTYPERPGAESLDLARTWLASGGDKPYFLWVHLYEPHTPYAPPASFKSGAAHPYDGEIVYTDHLLGQFFSFLKEKGLYEDALIVLLSDHGEGLGDHGEVEHGLFTWRESIHVPLVMKLPGSALAGERVAESVALTDVFPTLLHLLQLPEGKTDGQALLSKDTLKGKDIYSEAMTGELFYGWHASRSVVHNNLHYMEGREPGLFDLEKDFQEKTNLYGTEPIPSSATALMDAMTGGVQVSGQVSDEDKALLESLGYTGGFEMGEDALSLSTEAFLSAYNSVKIARSLIENGEHEQAETMLQEKLQAHPSMIGIRAMLTQALYYQEKYEAAAHVCREGLAKAPNHEGLLVALTGVELALGRNVEAQILARKCLEVAPVVGGRKLTPLFFEKGFYKMSAELAGMVGCHDGVFAHAWRVLSEMADKPGGDFRSILTPFIGACEPKLKTHEVADILLFVGGGLAGLSRFDEAEPVLKEALKLKPDHGPMRRELVRFHMARKQMEKAVEVVDQWVFNYPTRNNYLQASRIMEEVGIGRAAEFYRTESQKYPETQTP